MILETEPLSDRAHPEDLWQSVRSKTKKMSGLQMDGPNIQQVM